MLLYVSGPKTEVMRANELANELRQKGHVVYCQQANSGYQRVSGDFTEQDITNDNLTILAVCDGLVLLKDWAQDTSAQQEHAYAAAHDIPVFVAPNLPDLHLTEVRCPIQVKTFRETIGAMHRVHLRKNADYSPSNILGTGHTGLVTRLWDKVARWLNLTGWQVTVISPDPKTLGRNLWVLISRLMILGGLFFQGELKFTGDLRKAQNEATEDALMDLAVYGVIGKLLAQDAWGK